MNRLLNKILLAATLPMFAATATAQLGIAVAKDKNNSAIRYSVSTGGGSIWKAQDHARNTLKKQGYKKINTQTGNAKVGHDLASGVYGVVKVRYKLNRKWRTSYGLGASSSSYAEAERRAVKNLSTYDWSWSTWRGKPQVFERRSF